MPQRVDAMNLPFALTRFLSLVSLVLILVSSIGLAFFIGKNANQTLLNRQQKYSQLIADNLNQQIYRRFTLPTYLAFGRIALQHPAQYERLNEVVQSSIVGQKVEALRIFDQVKIVGYSINKDDVGNENLAPEGIDEVFTKGKPIFEIQGTMSHLRALFSYNLPDKSFLLHTIYPLSIDNAFHNQGENPDGELPVLGILELTQDITEDYETVIRFQWLIFLTCVGSSFVLYAILQFFISRAEKILAERMVKTRKLEAELHQNERLASMGRVISSIAHEIRNPLGIIRSSAELLVKRPSIDEPSKRILTAIFDESCRLSQTVNDFLDYARPRKPKQMYVDMALIIDQATGFLESEFNRLNVCLTRHMDEDLMVIGDKDLLYRAVYNVLANALQAMEPVPRTNMEFSYQDLEKNLAGQSNLFRSISIYGRADVENVTIMITDSGPGFPPDTLGKALDPFYTTKDNGTGLGLPIVNSIISSHNGRVELDNSSEGGAQVSLILPKHMEKNDE